MIETVHQGAPNRRQTVVRKMTRAEMVAETLAQCDCSLDDLEELMRLSSWQMNELSKIKGKPGFKLAQRVYGFLDKICCSNLYTYTHDCAHEGRLYTQDDDDVERIYSGSQDIERVERSMSEGCGKLARLKGVLGSASFRRFTSDQWLRARPSRMDQSHDEQNAHVFGRNRKLTWTVLLTRLLLVYYIYCAIGILMSTYYQYIHDYFAFHLTQYRAVKESVAARGNNHLTSRARTNEALYEMYRRSAVNETGLMLMKAEARQQLVVSGSFLLEVSYFAQCTYILMLGLTVLTYSGPLLYFVRHAFDFYFIRLILDWDQEQANCNKMVADIIRRVTHSSEIFREISLYQWYLGKVGYCVKRSATNTLAHFHRLSGAGVARWNTLRLGQKDLNEMQAGLKAKTKIINREPRAAQEMLPGGAARSVLCPDSPFEPIPRNKLSFMRHVYSFEHKWMVSKLKQLALAGELQPLDRNDTDHLDRALNLAAIGPVCCTSSCILWNILLFSNLPSVYHFNYELSTKGIVSFVQLATLNVLLTVAGSHYIALAILSCFQQVQLVRQLRLKIANFVELNRYLLSKTRLVRADNDQLELELVRDLHTQNGDAVELVHWAVSVDEFVSLYYDAINTELLLILMHYKIMMAQLRPSQRTFSGILGFSLGLMTLFPLLARLHVPYMMDKDTKVLIVIVCLIMISLPDTGMIPICWMNSRCLKLYDSLWSLMAVVVEISNHHKLGALIHEHSVWMLRKELDYPDHYKDQFAYRALGFRFTYSELMRLHFWLGLIIISFVIEFKSSRGLRVAATSQATEASYLLEDNDEKTALFDSLLTDPLGIVSSFSIR